MTTGRAACGAARREPRGQASGWRSRWRTRSGPLHREPPRPAGGRRVPLGTLQARDRESRATAAPSGRSSQPLPAPTACQDKSRQPMTAPAPLGGRGRLHGRKADREVAETRSSANESRVARTRRSATRTAPGPVRSAPTSRCAGSTNAGRARWPRQRARSLPLADPARTSSETGRPVVRQETRRNRSRRGPGPCHEPEMPTRVGVLTRRPHAGNVLQERTSSPSLGILRGMSESDISEDAGIQRTESRFERSAAERIRDREFPLAVRGVRPPGGRRVHR